MQRLGLHPKTRFSLNSKHDLINLKQGHCIFLTATGSGYGKETCTPRLINGFAALLSAGRNGKLTQKAQYIDFFLDIQQYIVIRIVIPP
jgi:hypothetical protein